MLMGPVMQHAGPCGGTRGSIRDALRIGLARVGGVYYIAGCVRHFRWHKLRAPRPQPPPPLLNPYQGERLRSRVGSPR